MKAIDEVEVYVTPSGLGRAAIVRRDDGFFCIYRWAKLPQGFLPARFAPSRSAGWREDQAPLADLYRHVEPLVGIYGTAAEARREILSLPGFADATLHDRTDTR